MSLAVPESIGVDISQSPVTHHQPPLFSLCNTHSTLSKIQRVFEANNEWADGRTLTIDLFSEIARLLFKIVGGEVYGYFLPDGVLMSSRVLVLPTVT